MVFPLFPISLYIQNPVNPSIVFKRISSRSNTPALKINWIISIIADINKTTIIVLAGLFKPDIKSGRNNRTYTDFRNLINFILHLTSLFPDLCSSVSEGISIHLKIISIIFTNNITTTAADQIGPFYFTIIETLYSILPATQHPAHTNLFVFNCLALTFRASYNKHFINSGKFILILLHLLTVISICF